jgi:hypothetical protein
LLNPHGGGAKGLGFATPPPQGETDPLAVLMVLLYHDHPLDAEAIFEALK